MDYKNSLRSLIKWAERHIKTDMVYLLKGGFWLTLGQIALAVISLALSVALANLIPPKVLGQYKFVLAGASIIGAFALTGMTVAAIRSIARGFEGTLLAGARDSLRWSFGIIILALGTSLYYYINGNFSLALSFLIVAGFSPIIASTSLFVAHFNGTKRFAHLTLFNVIRQFLIAVAVVVTINFTVDPLLIVLAYFLVDATVCSVLFLITQLVFVKNLKTEVSTLPYSKHLSLMEVIKIIASQIDKILIFTFLGAGPLAVYTIAMAPITQLKGIDQTIASLAFPKFSQRPFSELQKTLVKKVALLTGAMALLALAYIFTAPYIFRLLFPQYIESVIYSQVYTISLIVIPSILFTKALTAHQKTKEQYILKTVTPTVKIVLLLVLLPFFGLWGALYALILSELFWLLLSFYLFSKSNDV